jgi:hypothetical protein
MLRNCRVIWLGLALGLFAGCGGSGPSIPDEEPKEYASTADLKTRLEEIARTGVGGSAVMGFQDSIEKTVRPKNAALADDLLQDLKELEHTTEAEQTKAIASRMAGKL